MSEEILINCTPMESRVALLTDGATSEILIERHKKQGLVGNIYLGTVVRVLPGMQAAFVDIGRTRTAFLHASDMQKSKKSPQANAEFFQNTIGKLGIAGKSNPNSELLVNFDVKKNESKYDLIQSCLQEGDKIVVQVIKDELGTKGARLTTNISLPSRYLVYLPTHDEYIGISIRIEDENERDRLKNTLSKLMSQVNLKGGLIARTAAEKISEEKLQDDIYYLIQLWHTIIARQAGAKLHSKNKAELLYQELSLPLRCIRDLVNERTTKIVIDHEMIYHQVANFSQEFMPFTTSMITYYTGETPLFDLYRVEEDLQNALNRRVELKSGGYLIIDQTEAMTTIDVNTGSYVGSRSLEDTVYKTNLEATHAIARQIRLRNLGGIIILDFIDMLEGGHRQDVLESLQKQLAKDGAKTNITQVSDLGLVEMTRKRTRESLPQQLCEPCSVCNGKGFVKTAETVCFEIFREVVRYAKTYNKTKQFTIFAHQSVVDWVLLSNVDFLTDLESVTGRILRFEIEPLYTQEQFNIILE